VWALHIVVVRGGTGWPSALIFGLVACLCGWLFASLAAESRLEAALTFDLVLAAIGALLGQLAAAVAGADPLATIFGVHLFAVAFGALLLLSLGHDAAALERLPARLRPPISLRGGLCCTFLGLTSWPSAVQPSATYRGGLRIAQTSGTLCYEVRCGPLRGARQVVLPGDSSLVWRAGVLSITAAEAREPLLRLEGVVPTTGACSTIGAQASDAATQRGG
jgi:hypothetical protein